MSPMPEIISVIIRAYCYAELAVSSIAVAETIFLILKHLFRFQLLPYFFVFHAVR